MPPSSPVAPGKTSTACCRNIPTPKPSWSSGTTPTSASSSAASSDAARPPTLTSKKAPSPKPRPTPRAAPSSGALPPRPSVPHMTAEAPRSSRQQLDQFQSWCIRGGTGAESPFVLSLFEIYLSATPRPAQLQAARERQKQPQIDADER